MPILSTLVFLFISLPSVERIAFEDYQSANPGLVTGVIHVDKVGADALEHLKKDFDLAWWVENNRELLVQARWESLHEIAHEFQVTILNKSFSTSLLAFAKLGKDDPRHERFKILSRSGPFAVVELTSPLSNQDISPDNHNKGHHVTRLWPFSPNTVLVKLSSNKRSFFKSGNRSFQNLVDSVDAARWLSDIESLASYNRYTHSPDNLNARDWLVNTFESMPGLSVSTPAFQVSSTTAYNVVAVLTGSTRPDDWYIVGAHYDSISEIPNTTAPGAEDNASGTAGVLEMARIFSMNPPDATILFICFSGEEEGLYGSLFHVSQLATTGHQGNVKGVINMDMIGYTGDPELDCLLETRAFAADLSQVLEQAAATYTSLVISTSNNASGSDHVPYLNANIPAVLTIENDWNSYPDYHHSTDLPPNITPAMGQETLKMNVAALAEMAFSRANINYDQTQIINPGANGTADPGETLQINISLANSGQIAGTSISATLSSSDPKITIIQGVSGYSNIQPGGSQVNISPFEFYIDQTFPCGGIIQLELNISYDDGQTRQEQFGFELPTGIVLGAQSSAIPGLAIPDNNSIGIQSSLSLTDTGALVSGGFNVDIHLTHTYIGDLVIDLEAPDLTVVRLWDNSGAGSQNLFGNFPNNLTPAGNLSDFVGGPLDGTWTLYVKDTGAQDTGTLDSWGINDVQGYECESGECNLTLHLAPMGGGPSLIACAGDLVTIESTLTGASGSEIFDWEITDGDALIEGSSALSKLDIRPFSNCTITCTVADSTCVESQNIQLTVEKVSVTGDENIQAEDLFFLIETYWMTQTYNPGLDFNADGKIDLLDLIEYTACL